MTKRTWTLLCLLAALSLSVAPALGQDGGDGGGDGGGLTDSSVGAGDSGGAGGNGGNGGAAEDGGGEKVEGDGEKEAEDKQVGGRGPGGGLFSSFWIWIPIAVLILMLLFSSRTRKKQEAKRKEMLGHMKKGDKVVTIGGIVGTIIEARDSEVVVKVDEQSNTRMRFAKWSIRAVGEEVKEESAKTSQEQ